MKRIQVVLLFLSLAQFFATGTPAKAEALQMVNVAHRQFTLQAAPLEILDLSGFGFADSYDLQYAQGSPLPTKLGDLTIKFGDQAAPIFFARKDWVRVQVPDIPTGQVVVTALRDNGWQQVGTISIVPTSPSAFDAWDTSGYPLVGKDGRGCMALQNYQVSPDGQLQVVQPACDQAALPISETLYVSVWTTGLGSIFDPMPKPGQAAAGSETPKIVPTLISVSGITLPASVLVWYGPAPGYIGLEQYVLAIPVRLLHGQPLTPRNLQVMFGGSAFNIYEGRAIQ